MENTNIANVAENRTTEEMLYETAKDLPEEIKLVLLGVARGLGMSTDIPSAG